MTAPPPQRWGKGGKGETAEAGHAGREPDANIALCIVKREGESTSPTKPQSAPVNYVRRVFHASKTDRQGAVS